MNIPSILAIGAGAPQMLVIIFWLLIVLWAIGAIGYSGNPIVVRGNNIIIIVLFAILGYYTFGF